MPGTVAELTGNFMHEPTDHAVQPCHVLFVIRTPVAPVAPPVAPPVVAVAAAAVFVAGRRHFFSPTTVAPAAPAATTATAATTAAAAALLGLAQQLQFVGILKPYRQHARKSHVQIFVAKLTPQHQ